LGKISRASHVVGSARFRGTGAGFRKSVAA